MEAQIDYVAVFKALADETRLKIIELLSCGELCACEILESFQITQPTLSYHMKILTESGIVTSRKNGPWMLYSINAEVIAALKSYVNLITTEQENCICKKGKGKVRCDSLTSDKN